jgi:hypothetical protein
MERPVAGARDGWAVKRLDTRLRREDLLMRNRRFIRLLLGEDSLGPVHGLDEHSRNRILERSYRSPMGDFRGQMGQVAHRFPFAAFNHRGFVQRV